MKARSFANGEDLLFELIRFCSQSETVFYQSALIERRSSSRIDSLF